MTMRKAALAVALVFALHAQFAQAAIQKPDLYRGARAMAMGGAYTALADDEQAVYLNPAGLADNKRTSIQALVTDIDFASSLITDYKDVSAAFKGFDSTTIDALMGKQIYARVQLTPTIMLRQLAVSIFYDQHLALITRNKALPNVILGYQQTKGVQFAYGLSLGKRAWSGNDIRIGVGTKMLWRKGGYRDLTLSQLLSAGSNTLTQIAGTTGLGIGVDLGAQYIRPINRRLTLQTGLAMTDVGDTTFGSSGADVQAGNLSAGVAAIYRVGQTSVKLDYDYRDLLSPIDWRKKNHVGLDLGLAMVNAYLGLNQLFLTYGAGIDVWLMKITAISYAEEQATLVKQDPQRRYLLRLAVKLEL